MGFSIGKGKPTEKEHFFLGWWGLLKKEIKKTSRKWGRGNQRIQRGDIREGGGYPFFGAFWFWAKEKESKGEG